MRNTSSIHSLSLDKKLQVKITKIGIIRICNVPRREIENLFEEEKKNEF